LLSLLGERNGRRDGLRALDSDLLEDCAQRGGELSFEFATHGGAFRILFWHRIGDSTLDF